MSSNAYDNDPPAKPKRSGPPTWLIILLSVILVFGLLCVGGVALMVFSVKSAIHSGQSQMTSEVLLSLRQAITAYQAENGVYPDSLKQISGNTPSQVAYDARDPNNQASLIYLVPGSNAQPSDILIYTSRTGPLPILAVRINGSTGEFASVGALDNALNLQRLRPPPPGAAPLPPTPPLPSDKNQGNDY
ncbi:MAG TPA: hypothetical protein VL860_01345 [Planctomycetota bacterium]|nr:hypothetical protein [Planctomycetota bacterium]